MNALGSIWRIVRASPRLYATTGTLIILAGYLLPLAPGLLVKALIDTLTGDAQAGWNAESVLVLLAVVAVTHTAIEIATGVAEPSLALVAGTLLRRNMLQRVLERPVRLPVSPGEAIGRFRNDVDEVGAYVAWTADPLGQTLAFVLGLAVLARVDAALTLLVFAVLLVVAGTGSWAVARLGAYRKAKQEAIGQVTGLLGELFAAALAIKAAGAEQRVVAHLGGINEQRRRAGLRDQVFTQFFVGMTKNVANVGSGLLLLAAAAAMRDGRFSVGDFALFVSYLSSLAQAAGWVSVYVARYRQMKVSLDRVQALLPDSRADGLAAPAPLHLRHGPPPLPDPALGDADPLQRLDALHLTVRYPATGRGIEEIDLTLERGTVTVVTGRVGAGKTTLLRTLLGFQQRQAGEIRWNGQLVADVSTSAGPGVPPGIGGQGGPLVPPRVAYTPQAPRLFSESLRDNILMGLPERDGRLERALRAAVLERDLPLFQHGLDTLVGARGVKLSGGQLQRAAAARMFAREPELLVMDDLSSALDVETEALLWERLAGMPDATVLAVSHRRAALRRADQIVVLVDGRVADRGTLPELLDRCEELRRLWEHG